MTEEQQEHFDQLYEWYVNQIQSLLSDLLSVEDMEVQEAILQKLNEQFRFK